MVNPEVIRKRLHRLDEYLEVLRRLQRYDLEQFTAEPERYGSAERFYRWLSKPCWTWGTT